MASNKNTHLPTMEDKGPSFVVFDKTQNDISSNSNISQLTHNKHLLNMGRGMKMKE
jgi:hypothetical protein